MKVDDVWQLMKLYNIHIGGNIMNKYLLSKMLEK